MEMLGESGVRRRGFFHYGEPSEVPSKWDNPILELYRRQRDQNLGRGRPAADPDGWRSPHHPPVSRRDLSEFDHVGHGFTAAQRLHLEVFGYVVVERLLSPAETDELRGLILELEARHRRGEAPPQPCFVESSRPYYFRVDNLLHLGPAFFDYLTHPSVVARAAEAVGVTPRLQQSDAHVRRAGGDTDAYEFHGGTWMSGTIAGGLYHFGFVKALTNLTDLGAGDGGTAVIPGTHKLPVDCDRSAVVEAALADRRLVHEVEAPAGSTLFFFESLLHSRGLIRTGRERVLIIGGYAPQMYQAASGNEPDAELLARLPRTYREFLDGEQTFFAD